jgi:hypothetical protein
MTPALIWWWCGLSRRTRQLGKVFATYVTITGFSRCVCVRACVQFQVSSTAGGSYPLIRKGLDIRLLGPSGTAHAYTATHHNPILVRDRE